MSLEQIQIKIKALLANRFFAGLKMVILGLLITVDIIGFMLIKNTSQYAPIAIEKGFFKEIFASKLVKESDFNTENSIVASKNGTRYYFSHCSGVNRIKIGNRVYFSSEKEAEMAGYTIAANCK